LWGNPLYRWGIHDVTGYAWWVRRMRAILDTVDIVRIDHFRGFEAHWEVPGDAQTARDGRWVKGPGGELFKALLSELGSLPIIAEDLGVITPEVERLRDQFGLPGMRILQFAFGCDPQADSFRPESFPVNCVAYTGTHDNDTTVGWFHSKPGRGSTRTACELREERNAIKQYFGTDGGDIQWSMIAEVLKSKACTAILPLQDVMGLGTEARMNQPGTREGNWEWRFSWDMLTPKMIDHLRQLTTEAGRV
jgi:4-alpha-glucanotransferase